MRLLNRTRVLVVGGGPAGATGAAFLAAITRRSSARRPQRRLAIVPAARRMSCGAPFAMREQIDSLALLMLDEFNSTG
ncbi:hypothetical protein I6G56_15810 [Burkholderia humptydooensis]|uniref:Uncharacterized protein n=2 Tax=Burkholderia humptydooensis TaxID=430531 RepID=A0A7T2WXU6_9BURK|nr:MULTISPECIES: hypothetical protein [Burkholderia]AJY42109.1 hypothetical protein BW21_1068 [Burkholderia sp. 2002721687]QPS43018.1 hypothetical protein I6G56_15810 [Burkholderia humptydooensis]